MNPWIRLVFVLVWGPPPEPTHIPGGVMVAPLRTLPEIELDITDARNQQRRGPARRYVTEVTPRDALVNRLLDEWATVHAMPQFRYV